MWRNKIVNTLASNKRNKINNTILVKIKDNIIIGGIDNILLYIYKSLNKIIIKLVIRLLINYNYYP